jgi:hypothetical protein
MAENRDAAIRTRRRLIEVLGTAPIAPESMLGSMASVELPRGLLASDTDARALRDALAIEDGIEVPISPFPVPAARAAATESPTTYFVRVSHQRYVDDGDVDRLVEAFERRGIAKGTPQASAIVGA